MIKAGTFLFKINILTFFVEVLLMILFYFVQDYKTMYVPFAIAALLVFAVFIVTAFLLWILGWIYIMKTAKNRQPEQNIKIQLLMLFGNILSGYIAYAIYKKDNPQKL